MHNEELISNLVTLSRNIGSNLAYIQGGGGNTSVKIDDKVMAIKASGHVLKQMQNNSGYCLVAYQEIVNNLQSNTEELHLSKQTKQYVLPSSPHKTPSIETSFHAILNKYVIHSHSVYANLLNCSAEGPDIIKKLFPHALWIPYYNVGFKLAQEILNRCKSSKTPPNVIFLQNHGLIISNEQHNAALLEHTAVNKKIRNFFGITGPYQCNDKATGAKQILFPDQVVYCDSRNPALLQSRAAHETLCAASNIIKLINSYPTDTKVFSQTRYCCNIRDAGGRTSSKDNFKCK